MIPLSVLVGPPALVAAVGAIVLTARDGYRAAPVRHPLDRVRPL